MSTPVCVLCHWTVAYYEQCCAAVLLLMLLTVMHTSSSSKADDLRDLWLYMSSSCYSIAKRIIALITAQRCLSYGSRPLQRVTANTAACLLSYIQSITFLMLQYMFILYTYSVRCCTHCVRTLLYTANSAQCFT
jgi:hypothetical protein